MRLLPFIDQQRVHHSVQQLCQMLDVVPSGYYTLRFSLQRDTVGELVLE